MKLDDAESLPTPQSEKDITHSPLSLDDHEFKHEVSGRLNYIGEVLGDPSEQRPGKSNNGQCHYRRPDQGLQRRRLSTEQYVAETLN